MLSTASASARWPQHRIWAVATFVVMLIYAGYLAYEANLDTSGGRAEILAHHHAMLAGERVDAVIVGGSNGVFGLSAEQLTAETGTRFYNLSLMNEAFGPSNYQEFLESVMTPEQRARVELLVYSPIYFWPLSHGFGNVPRDIYGKPKRVQLVPARSLFEELALAFGFDVRAGGGEDYTYAVAGRFGDFDFDAFTCEYPGGDVHPASNASAVMAVAAERLAIFGELFPNAKQILNVPSVDPEVHPMSEEVRGDLEASAIMAGLPIIFSPAVPDTSLLCEVPHHMNATGRDVRTADLARQLAPYL